MLATPLAARRSPRARRAVTVAAAGVALAIVATACSPLVATTNAAKQTAPRVGSTAPFKAKPKPRLGVPTALPTTPAPTTPASTTPAPTTSAPTTPAPTTPASTTAAVAPVGVAGTWKLAADDEFDANALDASMWSVGEPWNAAPGFAMSDDSYCPLPATGLVTEGGGALNLNAKLVASNGKHVQSCFVTSRNKYSFTHGYLETRVKVPSSPGLWPAFWLLGNGTGSEGWPKTGEIDMFEFVNNGRENGIPFFTVHYSDPTCSWGHCQKTQDSPWPTALDNYAGRWITYGIQRTSTSLTIYIDGKPKATFTRNTTNPDGLKLGSVLFDAPMHVRFDLAAGGWAQDPNKTTQAGTFSVDYLRAWTS